MTADRIVDEVLRAWDEVTERASVEDTRDAIEQLGRIFSPPRCDGMGPQRTPTR